MNKNTWRTERFRSADVRRNAHQRAAKSAQKRRRKLCSAVRSAEAETKKALKEVFIENWQRIVTEPNEATKQTISKAKTTMFLDKVFNLAINILLYLALICIVLSTLEPIIKALFTGQWLAAVGYAITTAICFWLAQLIYKRLK